MGHPVLGNPNSKFRAAGMRGMKSGCSPVATGVASAGPSTIIPALREGEVAVVHDVRMHCTLQASAAAQATNTWTLNGGTMKFTCWGDANSPTTTRYDFSPKGSLVIVPNGANPVLTAQANVAQAWHMKVRYQRMRLVDAIQAGYMPGVPWVGTATGAAAPVDIVTAAAVTPKRGLEVRGFAITGKVSTAASGAIQEIMIGFFDGAAVERKMVKNCYAKDTAQGSPQLIVGNCRIRGPVGFGIRHTPAENNANAQTAAWGFFYPSDQGQRTWPGTGIPPASATGAFTGGDYFWLYSEVVTNATATNWFPTTTVANNRTPYVIDGIVCTLGGSNGDAAAFSIGFSDNAKVVTEAFTMNCITVASSGAVAYVREDVNMELVVADPIAFAAANGGGGDVDKACFLAWGRFGASSNTLTGYRVDSLNEV
jgi:hypothetical protein